MALMDSEGNVLEKNGVDLPSTALSKIREAVLLHTYVAEELSEPFKYVKLKVGNKTLICGFSEDNILILFPESEAEEVEAVSRFNA